MLEAFRRHPATWTLAVGAAVAFILGMLFTGAGQPEMAQLLHRPFAPVRWVLEPWQSAVKPLLKVFAQDPEIEAIFEALSGILGIVLYGGLGRGAEELWWWFYPPLRRRAG